MWTPPVECDAVCVMPTIVVSQTTDKWNCIHLQIWFPRFQKVLNKYIKIIWVCNFLFLKEFKAWLENTNTLHFTTYRPATLCPIANTNISGKSSYHLIISVHISVGFYFWCFWENAFYSFTDRRVLKLLCHSGAVVEQLTVNTGW